MILSTTDIVPEGKVIKTLGVVRGNIVLSRSILSDIKAWIRNFFGGEIGGYSTMVTNARQKAVERMIADAKKMGADAVVDIGFSSSPLMEGVAEVLAYGTAVKLQKNPKKK